MKKNINKLVVGLMAVIAIITFQSCDKSKDLAKEETRLIEDYLVTNSDLNFVKQPSGLYYLEVETGTGIQPVKHDTAYVRFTGRYLDGVLFTSNVTDTADYIFPVDESVNITGFDEGVTLMKVGGKCRLLIPSSLAYGPAGFAYYDSNYIYRTFPGYTPLEFEIELIKVKPGPGK